jgi:phage tail-like protein
MKPTKQLESLLQLLPWVLFYQVATPEEESLARSSNSDILDTFRWSVKVEGFTKLGFQSCSTPGHKFTVNKYPEGGSHLNPRSIIDSNEFTPVILSVGVTNDTSFSKWASGPFDLVQNNAALGTSNTFFGATVDAAVSKLGFAGPSLVQSSATYPFSYRRNVKIEHINRLGIVEVVYTLYNAFVVEYKPASDFDAESDEKVSITSITLSYDGYDVKYAKLSSTVQTIVLT